MRVAGRGRLSLASISADPARFYGREGPADTACDLLFFNKKESDSEELSGDDVG